MARRKKTRPAEDVIDLVALLPWYVGVVLAVAAYLVLHRLAIAPMTAALKPGDVGAAMTGAVWRGLAGVGQYVLPGMCLAGAAVSAWRRRTRHALVENVTRSEAPGMLDNMSWREFEMLVGEGFHLQGYSVAENFQPGPDEGIDLRLRKDGETYLVQCKQWRAFKVGVPVVRELYGVMAAKGAAGGFVVTSGRFTAEAETFAEGRNVRLLDGPKLERMLKQARAGVRTPQAAASPAVQAAGSVRQNASPLNPVCPKCSQQMKRRQATKGARAGQDFWGCVTYPQCRGTRAVEANA
ncbi:MAG: restriction endonuclease [Pseudomonas sp.]|uniref:restriction endonuclease n=1 Tax=Pseudomonas sp. TaxID=306 RepID=UPI001200EC64|nr:restriction endonuclease [Pseudomonas sp.]RZI68702.1 MAG: restriction endonuclease [Pseudomonas sp.]